MSKYRFTWQVSAVVTAEELSNPDLSTFEMLNSIPAIMVPLALDFRRQGIDLEVKALAPEIVDPN